MIIGFKHQAGPFTIFTKEAAEDMVGQTFVAKIEQTPVGEGKVLQASITDDGRSIDLLIDFPDDQTITRKFNSIGKEVSINSAKKDNHV